MSSKRDTFDQLVQRAIERIPQEFRDAMENIEILVEDWPDPQLMEEVTGNRKTVVYGLFVGTPLPLRRADDWGALPGLIYLFRQPLLQDFPSPEQLAREIEITLAHEIAHYMGYNEETLSKYGYG